jgi:predicted small metal-binding protein
MLQDTKMEPEMYTLKCADIGIEGCDFVATEGSDAQESVLEQMVTHLRKRHGLKLTAKQVGEGHLDELDTADRMVATRLRSQLQLQT